MTLVDRASHATAHILGEMGYDAPMGTGPAANEAMSLLRSIAKEAEALKQSGKDLDAAWEKRMDRRGTPMSQERRDNKPPVKPPGS